MSVVTQALHPWGVSGSGLATILASSTSVATQSAASWDLNLFRPHFQGPLFVQNPIGTYATLAAKLGFQHSD